MFTDVVEAPKLVISLLLTITMSVFVCAHFKSKRYSRVLLALTSIGMSLFAIIAGISTGLLLGLELVPLVLMVAYLILGKHLILGCDFNSRLRGGFRGGGGRRMPLLGFRPPAYPNGPLFVLF